MEKIALWSVQAKMAKEDFYKQVAEGVTVAANGTIQLTHDASKLISQFISWLFESGQVSSSLPTPSPSYPSASSSLSLNVSQPFDFLTSSFSFANYSFTFDNSVHAVIYQVGNSSNINCYVILASGSPGATALYNSGTVSLSNTFSYSSKTVYYYSTRIAVGYPVSSFNGLPLALTTTSSFSSVPQLAWTSIYGTIVQPENPGLAEDLFVGSEADWDENKDLLNPAIDDVTTLTPDLINKLIDQLADGQTATMDIATYLDSLVDSFDGLKAQVAELTDAVTGAKTNVAVPDSITTDVTVDPVNPISVPAVDPVELSPGGTIEGFSFPLDEIFPFCIPFDVVAALELFDVPAEAPSIHVHWELPYNIVFDFDLDLSAYDDIAALLRVMETILFAVGLAVATRSLYIRS